MKPIFKIDNFIISRNRNTIFFITDEIMSTTTKPENSTKFETKKYTFFFEDTPEKKIIDNDLEHFICLVNKNGDKKFLKGTFK